jgi:hypothetical protein
MFRYIKRLKIAVILLLLLPLTSINADSFLERLNWNARGSIFYFAADNGVDSDPAPIIPSAGFSITLDINRNFRLEFTEDIYFTNYEYNSILGYPMACNPENRSAFVLGFLTGLQLTGFIPLGENGMGLRIFGGPAIDIRLVTLAFGLNHPADFTGDIETDAQMQTDAIREYFWSDARWFYPVAGIGMDFPINERFLVGFDFRCWFPLYRQWTDHELPAIDGWRFGAGFRITSRRSGERRNQTPEQVNQNIIFQPIVEQPVIEPIEYTEEHFNELPDEYEEYNEYIDNYEEEYDTDALYSFIIFQACA